MHGQRAGWLAWLAEAAREAAVGRDSSTLGRPSHVGIEAAVCVDAPGESIPATSLHATNEAGRASSPPPTLGPAPMVHPEQARLLYASPAPAPGAAAARTCAPAEERLRSRPLPAASVGPLRPDLAHRCPHL